MTYFQPITCNLSLDSLVQSFWLNSDRINSLSNRTKCSKTWKVTWRIGNLLVSKFLVKFLYAHRSWQNSSTSRRCAARRSAKNWQTDINYKISQCINIKTEIEIAYRIWILPKIWSFRTPYQLAVRNMKYICKTHQANAKKMEH